MTFFGLTNPWIIASYIGCFVAVVMCIYVGVKAKNLQEEDD